MTNASNKANRNCRITKIDTQIYEQTNINVQNNPYLTGVNKAESSQIWKRLTIEEKTTVE